jgi:2-polyprenyl-6-methoxyphenol hydroxylase-like FAD-dependent oxidoreductase
MKVLVAGAGPAGAATALLLARCGLDVTLVERERSFERERVFRGEGLMPLGIDALFEMGLGGDARVYTRSQGGVLEHLDRWYGSVRHTRAR